MTAQQSTAAKSAPKAAATKQTASKQAPKQTGKQVATKQGKQTATAKKAAPRYYPQMQPTAERYKEIQDALAGKGYFAGPSDGSWGASSVDALKRFQHD